MNFLISYKVTVTWFSAIYQQTVSASPGLKVNTISTIPWINKLWLCQHYDIWKHESWKKTVTMTVSCGVIEPVSYSKYSSKGVAAYGGLFNSSSWLSHIEGFMNYAHFFLQLCYSSNWSYYATRSTLLCSKLCS